MELNRCGIKYTQVLKSRDILVKCKNQKCLDKVSELLKDHVNQMQQKPLKNPQIIIHNLPQDITNTQISSAITHASDGSTQRWHCFLLQGLRRLFVAPCIPRTIFWHYLKMQGHCVPDTLSFGPESLVFGSY